jgi:hypothetical protein
MEVDREDDFPNIFTPSLSQTPSGYSWPSRCTPASIAFNNPWESGFEERAVEEMVLEAVNESVVPAESQIRVKRENDTRSEGSISRTTPTLTQLGHSTSENSSTEERTPTSSMYRGKEKKRRKKRGDEDWETWEDEPQPKKTYHHILQVRNPERCTIIIDFLIETSRRDRDIKEKHHSDAEKHRARTERRLPRRHSPS